MGFLCEKSGHMEAKHQYQSSGNLLIAHVSVLASVSLSVRFLSLTLLRPLYSGCFQSLLASRLRTEKSDEVSQSVFTIYGLFLVWHVAKLAITMLVLEDLNQPCRSL